MYFDRNEPQPSTHAVSQPIDILRTSNNGQLNQLNYITASGDKHRPVNRVKPVIIKASTMNSLSSNSSSSSVNNVRRHDSIRSDEVSNKENCNRMPMIYNTYANPSTTFRTIPVAALTRNLFNYIAVSPACSTNYFFDEENRVADDLDMLMPTEFRSIGDIIGYANVIKSQRQQNTQRLQGGLLRRDRTLVTNQDNLH